MNAVTQTIVGERQGWNCQQRLQPLRTPLRGGCQLGRDIPALLAAAGFTAQMHARYLHRPHFAGYHYWGWAGRG